MAQSDIATAARYLQTIRAQDTYSVQIASVNATLEGLAASPPPPPPPGPHTDQFEQWYGEAARKVDSAESEAELAEVVALTNRIINAHFRQAHGQELQQKAKEIRAKALKSIESIKTRSK
jgi:transcriptional regulator GlxA family with amidase domain